MQHRSWKRIAALGIAGAITAAAAASAQQPDNVNFNDPVDVQEVSLLESGVQLFSNVDDLMRIVHRNVAAFGGDGWLQGWEAIYDNEARSYAAVAEVDRPSDFDGLQWIKDFNIATDGEIACVVMHIRIPMKEKDGSWGAYQFPELDVWRKFGAHWLAVQLHTYTPIDQESGESRHDIEVPHRGPLKWLANPLPGPAGDPATAKEELRAWLDKRTTSTDVNALIAMFGPGDDTIAYSPALPVEHRGLGEIRQSLSERLRGVRSISAEPLNFDVHSDGMISTILARQTVTFTMKDGSTRTVTSRHSNCLRRVGGEWRSIFEMISYPDTKPSRLEELRTQKAGAWATGD